LGAQNAVVSELNPASSGTPSLLYSTYIGGSGASLLFVGSFGDIGVGVTVDPASSSRVYIDGPAASQDFPTSVIKVPFQKNNQALFNAFVTELDTSQAIAANQLIYSTYLGGNGAAVSIPPFGPGVGDAGTDITVDAKGLISVTGATTSTNFPISKTCAALSSLNGRADAFVTILDPNQAVAANQLVFSTYLGGSDIDGGAALGRDSLGKLYVAGLTLSGDFPVTFSAFQFGNGAFAKGTTNAFVTVLDPSSAVCPTPFASPKATPSATRTATRTPSRTPTRTITRTPSKTPTRTPSKTPTRTPSKTATRTPSKTATRTPSKTATRTASKTATRTPSKTATRTASKTPTRTATRTPTRTPTEKRTPTAT
jgi:hypothetical protein